MCVYNEVYTHSNMKCQDSDVKLHDDSPPTPFSTLQNKLESAVNLQCVSMDPPEC